MAIRIKRVRRVLAEQCFLSFNLLKRRQAVRKSIVSLGLASMFFVAGAASAVSYVEQKSLKQVVTVGVGEVASTGKIPTGIITWGGDIATIYCNGNAKVTMKGSLCDKQGLQLELFREDVFPKQLGMYMSGKTPFLRGTLGQIAQAAEVMARDPRTEPIVFFKHTDSYGGDVLVVKESIKSPKDLKGKTIAMQAYGPHMEYLSQILRDAGLKPSDVNVKYAKDLTGTNETPGEAFRTDKSVDAAFVISPDAGDLTRNASGPHAGAEKSVKGARILLSTKTANRVIADVYVVRKDFYTANRATVEKFAHALMLSQDALVGVVKNKAKQAALYKQTFTAAAKILLDSEQAIAEAEGLYGDAEFAGLKGNVEFFTNANNPRSFQHMSSEIQTSFVGFGLLAKPITMAHAGFDYNALKAGVTGAANAPTERFDSSAVAQIVTKQQQTGKLDGGELFSFEVTFQPNQSTFPAQQYATAFRRVVELAATYGGAIITVEGHSDPMEYLRQKKAGTPDVAMRQFEQAAKNLSLSRANAVRDSVVASGRSQGVTIDPSQFAVVGHGVMNPKTGVCNGIPCAPKSEAEWRSNMRVVFRIISVEAESSAFKPL